MSTYLLAFALAKALSFVTGYSGALTAAAGPLLAAGILTAATLRSKATTKAIDTLR